MPGMPSQPGTVTEVVLGGPVAAQLNGLLEAEPLRCPACRSRFNGKPWVVGKDLDTGADDERHEEG